MHKKRPFSVHILRDVYRKRPFLVHIYRSIPTEGLPSSSLGALSPSEELDEASTEIEEYVPLSFLRGKPNPPISPPNTLCNRPY